MIANHILVSFHVAFVSSVIALPTTSVVKWEVLRFIFFSYETLVSAAFVYLSFHLCIALHEFGHFRTAARLNALNEGVLASVKREMQKPFPLRWLYYLGLLVRIPYGTAPGIKRQGLNYYPDAPYNLAVAAAGPRASRNTALATLPPAIALIAMGLTGDHTWAIYAGRALLGIGLVSFLDFRLADPGKYVAFRKREQAAAHKARSVGEVAGWLAQAPLMKRRMLDGRMQEATHPVLGSVTAPWQFRNCGMGGRHTEKEYPESNISMQEAMFLILRADSYQEAQELTVRLQNRLKEIIEKEEGCRVMGIGLEGGLAPYIEKGDFPLPEIRLWSMMKTAMADCGCRPGEDVAIALDPALTELELAYREEFNVPDSVGSYLFWRDKAKTVLDRDGVLDVYATALERYELPILSIEDGFSEDDHEGWRILEKKLGDRIFIIGDDLVTTNDKTIEEAADQGLINCALIKANQIGSLYETLLAMLVALGKGLELVVSHRSKSPNDDMEAHIALAANALGLKAGGGANTERLVKYQSVTELLLKVQEGEETGGLRKGEKATIRKIRAYEEPTNAGIPTVGATVEIWLPGPGVSLQLKGATPLGTSAGSGEAIHLVDSTVEYAEQREIIDRFPALFRDVELGVHAFKKDVDEARVRSEGDDELTALFHRAHRYGGKGCLGAVDNVLEILAPYFEGKDAAELTLLELDRALLDLELRTALRRGKLSEDADDEERIRVMQRKQNIGMNAMLSVSLAMGRAIARVQGKELYELLREEMLAIVDRAAAHYGIRLGGSRFSDYLEALQAVSARAKTDGKPLHEVLRALTGIYEGPFAEPKPLSRRPAEPDPTEDHGPDSGARIMEELAEQLGPKYRNDPHHGLRHAQDLLGRARRLSSMLGITDRVDWRVLSAAISLHDVEAEQERHGVAGAERARVLLRTVSGLSQEAIDRVADAIILHEERTPKGVARRKEAGLEAQLLYDADQLDAFGVKGIYRYVAVYTQRKKPLDRIAGDAKARFGSLAFDASRSLADPAYGFTVGFFDRLAKEGSAGDTPAGASGVVRFIRENAKEHPATIADKALSVLGSNGDGESSPEHRFAVEYFSGLRSAYTNGGESALSASWPEDSTSGRPIASLEIDANVRGAVDELNRVIFSVFGNGARGDQKRVLESYVETRDALAQTGHRLGIVNNRLFISGNRVLVPYLLDGLVALWPLLGSATDGAPAYYRFATGTILTDRRLLDLADMDGEAIDLETPLYLFDPTDAPAPRITRIRDAAAVLRQVNETTSRSLAVFWLRCLAARLCNLEVKDFLGAKNLQPEVQQLTTELTRFLNGPLRRRLPSLARLIVRNLSSLVGKPRVIDRLWKDTIDLAEIHIPGSAIVNELRRTSHHALGKKTLLIAEAYFHYLDTGATYGLATLGFGSPSKADVKARSKKVALETIKRVVGDLERLLGTSQIATRVEEWKEAYADAVVRCEFGCSIEEELQTIIEKGIEEANRWVYYHHLRILTAKVESFSWPKEVGANLLGQLDAARKKKPDTVDFDKNTTTRELTEAVTAFVRQIREAHQDDLFESLTAAIAIHKGGNMFRSFVATRELRGRLVKMIDRGGFEEQRYYLSQLECLLEEMGYMAMRHIATGYQDRGVEIEQCLQIIQLAALNLRYDGLFSMELLDFAAMVTDVQKSDEELLNVLENLERTYHRVRQRITAPYEKMQKRLGLAPDDLRLTLANMQRYMHDLNSMVHFADIAAAHVRASLSNGTPIRAATVETDAQPEVDPIIHLSDKEAVARAIEAGTASVSLRDRYGAKGSGLLYIGYLNIPTRDGFVLPTTIARMGLHKSDSRWLREQVSAHLERLERDLSDRDGRPRRFGGEVDPLVLAVRGGSVLSMPGILSTVVFVGMNDEIVAGLAKSDPWGAYDSYRRFLASYASAAWGVDLEQHDLVEEAKRRYKVHYKHELSWEAMKEIAEESKRVLRELGFSRQLDEILRDPFAQLMGAVNAVLDSWDTDTARRFREIKGICHTWKTAAIVQEMAFGNRANDPIAPGMDETRASLTGVIPRTVPTDAGRRAFEGEFKFSAAGDDLVSGMTSARSFRSIDELSTLMPMLETQLKHSVAKIRRFMGTDQEVELTVDRGVLSLLQTRRAEAHRETATDRFLEPGDPATRGLGVRGGGFRGLVAFDEDDLRRLAEVDVSRRDDVDGVLLVLENPSPNDIPLIISAGGLLTARGGSTSHAAVAINGIDDRDYSGVVSALCLVVDEEQHEASIVDDVGKAIHRIRTGDIVSIHGTTGEVYIGCRRRQQVPGTEK